MNRPLNAGKFRRKAYTKEGERAIIYKLNYAVLPVGRGRRRGYEKNIGGVDAAGGVPADLRVRADLLRRGAVLSA